MIASPPPAALASPAPAAAPQRCGYVEFIPIAQPRFDRSGQVFERIAIRIRYNDGTAATQNLDYEFSYPKKELDPFINPSLPDPFFQFPPKALAAKEPPLVQLVILHSDAQGRTKLCPGRPQARN